MDLLSRTFHSPDLEDTEETMTLTLKKTEEKSKEQICKKNVDHLLMKLETDIEGNESSKETNYSKRATAVKTTMVATTTSMEERRSRKGKTESSTDLPTISLDQVAWHDTLEDCWLVIYDYVYDCTKFLNHPGGQDVLLEYAGRDATLAFIGTGHSKAARENLERYLIGELPEDERIFRIVGGVNVTGV